ncbi:hypothetical protein Aduo_010518 [Ancylostoma duodenale]
MSNEAARQTFLPELRFSEDFDDSLVIRYDSDLHPIHCAKVFESLEQLRSDGHLCDVEFLVGNETISAHKIVLAASIPYFKAMFTTDMLEARKHRIRITNIDHTTLRDLILLMYGHDLTISRTNVQAIMVAANFLQIPHVTENCAVIIVDAIIEANFKLISRSEGLVELDVEEVVELLSKDELQVETEEQVFRAAMRWIEHSSSRTKHIARVLSCVRLHLLETEFFFDNVVNNPSIKNNASCRNIVEVVTAYFLVPQRELRSPFYVVKRRRCWRWNIFRAGGKRAGECVSDGERYDPLEKKWSFVQPMRRGRQNHCLAVNGGKIYAIGGQGKCASALREVEFYDVDRNVWIEVAPMMQKRYGAAAVFLDNRLYVCGGHNGFSHLASVEVYNPESNSWTAGVPMKEKRFQAEAVVIDGYIYVMGGKNELFGLRSVERFSPKNGRWEDIPDMVTSRLSFGACAMKNKIFVCGGWSGTNCMRDVECFDPRTMTWSSLPPMPVATGSSALASPEALFMLAAR